MAAMPPNPDPLQTPNPANLVALPTEQLVTRLREIKALLQASNMHAIALAKELLDVTSGDDKNRALALLALTEQLQFQAAEETVESWVDGLS